MPTRQDGVENRDKVYFNPVPYSFQLILTGRFTASNYQIVGKKNVLKCAMKGNYGKFRASPIMQFELEFDPARGSRQKKTTTITNRTEFS